MCKGDKCKKKCSNCALIEIENAPVINEGGTLYNISDRSTFLVTDIKDDNIMIKFYIPKPLDNNLNFQRYEYNVTDDRTFILNKQKNNLFTLKRDDGTICLKNQKIKFGVLDHYIDYGY